jgi:hypothetical protein
MGRNDTLAHELPCLAVPFGDAGTVFKRAPSNGTAPARLKIYN